jgi:hypothetical protein
MRRITANLLISLDGVVEELGIGTSRTSTGGPVYRAASLGRRRRRKAATLWRLAQRWLQ